MRFVISNRVTREGKSSSPWRDGPLGSEAGYYVHLKTAGSAPPRLRRSARGKLHEHVGDVLPFRDQEAVGNLRRDVSDVAGRERMPLAPLDSRAQILAGPAARLRIDHAAAEEQRAFAALHDHDVDDVVVLFGHAVGITIQQSK